MAKNQKDSSGSRGFTLVELLVVIAIIGILAAVTVPAVTSARDKGESAATEAEVSSYGSAAATVLAGSGSYPVPDTNDIVASCLEYDLVGGVPANPKFCCVADEPCTYAGRTLAPLSRGAFAPRSGGTAPLGGAMPRLPRLPKSPISVEGLQYQGVFHSCDSAACQNPTVTWTQPVACPAGTTRNGVAGLCQRKIDRTIIVIEQSETYCYDGFDNDEDGDLDCADADCAARANCGAETSEERCADDFDNDADGDVDCADSGCVATEECAGDVPETLCFDNDDNDNDSFTDCADSDCDGAVSPSNYVCEPAGEVTCSDGFDNDEDGWIDCADEASCTGMPGCVTGGVEDCTNGEDDNADGDVDCADTSCGNYPPCVVTELYCSNGFDDEYNGDGLVDCADPECDGELGGAIEYCEFAVEANCSDNFDNDRDGPADCADGDCALNAACSTPENTVATCGDSLDNDLDGKIDCLDSGCAGVGYCGTEDYAQRCQDGYDNDADGGLDCSDSGCFAYYTCGGTETSCTDDVDNDWDGGTDCGDTDCFNECSNP